MENSFFEYRDKTGADSGSEDEIIDDSMVLETVPVSYSTKKKNRTAFVPESDDSMSFDADDKEYEEENISHRKVGLSSAVDARVISSSEDDGSRRGSLRKPSETQNKVVVSSSEEDEEDYSPELVPKRRPQQKKSINPNESLILHRTKKRMLFQDSDTDNSIIIDRNKSNKLKCLKDTPLKVESKSTVNISNVDKSINCEDSGDGDDDEDGSGDDEDESDEENDDDVSRHHPNIRKNSKKINSDESDGENKGDASNNHHETSGKFKKLVINSDQSSDDENYDAIIHKNNSKSSRNVKKLMITSDDSDDDTNASKHQTHTLTKKGKKLVISDESDDEITSKATKKTDLSSDSHKSDNDYCSNNASQNTDVPEVDDNDDDGPDEDLMVMSRATRMSIMGIIPKDNDSDDSDFIQSDSSSRQTADRLTGSLEDLHKLYTKCIKPKIYKTSENSDNDLPEVTINQTQAISDNTDKNNQANEDDRISIHSNDSRISCSPFASPLQDITNKSIERTDTRRKSNSLSASKKLTDFMDLTVVPDTKTVNKAGVKKTDYMDLTVLPDTDNLSKNARSLSKVERKTASNKVQDESASVLANQNALHNDDDVAIIDTKPEIIALSSDDEDGVKAGNGRAPSPRNGRMESMNQYLAPSRPGQVVYVKPHVKQNELNKLTRLREDLNNVRVLLDEMDLESLPDGGSRLLARHGALEDEVRRQGDRVANMVVEPDMPSAEDIAKDGLGAGLSWDDIQKASNAVQPRMFGKQAMATHMAERTLIVDRLRDLHASLKSRPAESALAPAPRLLRATLLPYQRHALAWLQWRETQKPAAGILADDMGLGKTITMISLIASDKQDKLDHGDDPSENTDRDKLVRGGTLVVCPASLIQQWASEVSKHCTAHALSVCLHHGAARSTAPLRLATSDVVITTYNILLRDSDKSGVLARIQWRRIILDEAHIVRNHKSATSTAVSGLHGRRRWCLTGTPVQNKDLDLFALLKFLRLSPFDDLAMWKKWIDNKSQGGQERLNIVMQCILLRRTKVQLQEQGQLSSLPPRTAHTRLVTLASDEMNVYQKVLVLSKSLFAQFLHQRAEKNSNTTSFAAPGKDSEYAKMHKKMIALQGVKPVKSHEILVLLLRLRQVCCHCGLVGSMLDEGAPGAEPEPAGADLLRELDKLSLEDDKLSLEDDKRKSKKHDEAEEADDQVESAKADEAIRAVLAPNHPVFQLKRPSSKIKAVMECLDDVFSNKGDKAVVVSQWTSVLRLVQQELNKKNIRSVTLSGAVTVSQRPRLIDQVNDPKSDVKVMLLSLCAGGVGINLCGANHLLLLDPHWNPQLEQQAQDRIYRLGQNKPVHVYRFVCVDTVEQTIRKLQEKKLELANNVLTGAGNTGNSALSVEELKMMFNMGS